MPEQKEILCGGVVADPEARLCGVSETVGGIANLIEIAIELDEIDENARRRLGIITCQLVAQVRYVDILIRGVSEDEVQSESAISTTEPAVELAIGSNGHGSPAGSTLTRTLAPAIQPEVDSKQEDKPGKVDVSETQMPMDELERLIDDIFPKSQVLAVKELFINPGVRFRPAELRKLVNSRPENA